MSKAFYSNNRSKLRKKVTEELILIAGNSNVQASSDTTYPFKQDNSFYYLTGISEPGLLLVIDGADEYIIAPDFDEVRAAFDGATDYDSFVTLSGVNRVVERTAGWKILSKRIAELSRVAILESPEPFLPRYEMFANPARGFLRQQIIDKNGAIAFTDVRSDLAALRTVKTTYEIDQLRRAIAETKKLFDCIEDVRLRAKNERDILAAITAERIRLGLTDAYEPIIAGGANAVTLHYIANNAPYDASKLLLLDIGLNYNGYAADITRTVSNNPTQREYDVYSAVQDVQRFAIELLKPGLTMRSYEERVRDYMGIKLQELGLMKNVTEEAIRTYYPHSTSHFLGLDVHDVGDYMQPLKAGTVLTVEPGIYIPEEGIGIRIEDDVVVTKSGCEVLSKDLPQNISSLTIGVS